MFCKVFCFSLNMGMQASSASCWWCLTPYLCSCTFPVVTFDHASLSVISCLRPLWISCSPQVSGLWVWPRLSSVPVYGFKIGQNNLYLMSPSFMKSVLFSVYMSVMCIGIFLFFTTGLLFHNRVAKCYMCNICIAWS